MCVIGCLNRHSAGTGEVFSAPEESEVRAALKMCIRDRLKRERKVSILSVVHDIDFSVARWDRIAVLFGGRIVEDLPFGRFLEEAAHPYSRRLIESSLFFGEK